jgi:hypothetical protein
MQMELLFNAPIPDGLLASITLLSEKPRLGVPSRKSAPQQRIDERNCTAVLGLRFPCSEIVSGTVVAPNNGIKAKVCSAIPSGRTQGASGGLGGVGSVGGGGELVFNYNSGQVSAFGFGGVQVGWNGGASGSIYTGFVYGLNSSNSNYSGGFTGFNVGDGLGIFGASSSGGLTGGTGGLAPNGAVTAGGISLGGGLLGGLAGGATATNYTNPLQLGKLWAFDPLDALLYAARQLCN